MDYCNDFRYDLEIGQLKEKELGDILDNKKIEVKYDKQAHLTGNVFVEFISRGKQSGIKTTQADFWVFAIKNTFHIISVKELREKLIKNHKKIVSGGDNNTSKGILLPITELF